MEEVQDALLAYDSDINVLIAPKGYINTRQPYPRPSTKS